MKGHDSKLRLVLLVGLVGFFVVAVCTFANQNETQGSKPGSSQKTAASPASNSDYVGSDTCIACHQDQDRRFKGLECSHMGLSGKRSLKVDRK